MLGDHTPEDSRVRGIWRWPQTSSYGLLRLFLLTAITYSLGSQLALALIRESGLSSVFFIPAGITAAFLLRVPRGSWWAVWVPAGLAEGTMDLMAGYSTGATAGFVAGNVLGPVVGALVVTRFCQPVDLARLRHVWWFFVGSVLAGPGLAAAIGSAPAHFLDTFDFSSQFWQWWIGDALGVVMVGSAILVWDSSPDRRQLGSVWGASMIAGTLLLTTGVLVLSHLPLLFLVLVGVVVAGAVFGSRAVAVTGLLVAATIALDLAFGQLIPGLTPAEALIVIKLQLGVFTMAGLVVGAEAHELELASHQAAAAMALATNAESDRRLEHHIALTLQQSLLPHNPVRHPRVSIAARYEAGSEAMIIGGDWYDVIELTDNRIGFTIGDVVGHGLEAATAMSTLRTAISVLANHFQSPGELLTNLDRYARGINHIDFATASYSVLDTRTGLLTFASAGHPPMLLVSPSGRAAWLEEGRSPPLHGESVSFRPEASVSLDPGSLLIAYTDGLVERRNEAITAGLARLQTAVIEIRSKPVVEICDLLVAEMGVAEAREDDVVILVIRFDPANDNALHSTTVAGRGVREAAPAGSNKSGGVGANLREPESEVAVGQRSRRSLGGIPSCEERL